MSRTSAASTAKTKANMALSPLPPLPRKLSITPKLINVTKRFFSAGGGVYPVHFMLSFVEPEAERKRILKVLKSFEVERDGDGRLVKVFCHCISNEVDSAHFVYTDTAL
jgi:hypothetical protein